VKSGELNKSEETGKAYKITDVGITLRRGKTYSGDLEVGVSRWGLKRNNTTEQGLSVKANSSLPMKEILRINLCNPRFLVVVSRARHLSFF